MRSRDVKRGMKGRLATSRRLGVPGDGLPARDENLLLKVGVVISFFGFGLFAPLIAG